MKITKAEYEALPASLKALYKADGEDYVPTFKTSEEVDTLTAGLKTNNEKLLKEKREAAERGTAAEQAAAAAAEEAARKAGDVAALDKSYQTKLDAQKAEYEGKISKLSGTVSNLMVDSVALNLATKLGGKNSEVFLPHIKARLALEEGGENGFMTRVMKDGKPSALTVDELEAEFRANAAFAGILTGSGASGLPDTSGGKLKDTTMGSDNKRMSIQEQANALAAQLPSE